MYRPVQWVWAADPAFRSIASASHPIDCRRPKHTRSSSSPPVSAVSFFARSIAFTTAEFCFPKNSSKIFQYAFSKASLCFIPIGPAMCTRLHPPAPLHAAREMGRPNCDPVAADVDRDGPHMMVRSSHLRDLDVSDSGVPRDRDEMEVDDPVGNEFLHAVAHIRVPRRGLRDHQCRAAGPDDDLPEEHVGEDPHVPLVVEGLGHRCEGVNHQALDLKLLDV